ncbi:Potassium voltage-gated channel subfamily H member 5, partial [Durusdinium trenchii]
MAAPTVPTVPSLQFATSAGQYESFLVEKLQGLQEQLLQQHTHEVSHLRSANLLLREELLRAQGFTRGTALPGSNRPSAHSSPTHGGHSHGLGFGLAAFDGEDSEGQEPAKADEERAEPPTAATARWGQLLLKLWESADNSCSVSTVSEEELENLVMRSSWSMPWDKSFRMHHGRKIRVSRTEQSPMAMHMKDKVKDGSCLGRFVFGPYSMFPLLWSVVGCALILWDLVTIPLEMFNNIPQFIAFLSALGRVTFVFWFLDMPLNVLVGVEINGKVEQRPCVLLRRYLRWERAGSGEWHL